MVSCDGLGWLKCFVFKSLIVRFCLIFCVSLRYVVLIGLREESSCESLECSIFVVGL